MNTPEIPQSASGFKRVWKAFFYSISGLKLAFREEAAFRQELVLVVLLTPVCVLLPMESWLKIVIVFSHVLILVTELLNTAVEAIVNKTSPEYHDDAKKAKDTGSAAVLLAILLSLGLWVFAIVALVA